LVERVVDVHVRLPLERRDSVLWQVWFVASRWIVDGEILFHELGVECGKVER
jgi:hypothetical protein